jgi:excisionase family DNA binding protein
MSELPIAEDLVSPAMVPPWAAFIIARDFPQVLRSLDQKGRALASTGRVEHVALGRQLMLGVAYIKKAAREQEAAAGGTSGVGRSEVPIESADAALDRPPGSGLTTGEVAVKLGVGPRQVLNLIADKRLTATWTGSQHLVDELSVIAEIERRRRDRE